MPDIYAFQLRLNPEEQALLDAHHISRQSSTSVMNWQGGTTAYFGVTLPFGE